MRRTGTHHSPVRIKSTHYRAAALLSGFTSINGHQREWQCRFFVARRPLVARVLQGSRLTRTAPALILSRLSGSWCGKSQNDTATNTLGKQAKCHCE
jgi:hypothetical protein